ncbi:MAG: extracellular solute-binding protein [Ruminiclostridium sp.]|nr:extracellular solute-binding protein [Ruminiclostridium sp.]
MKNIKVFVLLATIVALVFTAACSGKSNTGTTSTGTAAVPQEEYVIKVMMDDYEDGTQPAITRDEPGFGQTIKEKFNVVIEWIPTGGSNIKELANTALAAGNYSDLVLLRGNDTVQNYINAGALLPLDDYLKSAKYFTKTYEQLIPFWRLASPDNKLYKWESNVLNTVGVGTEVAVRTDLLEEQGWPLLHSTKDYINFLKAAKEKHPTVDGKPSFGMVFPGADISGVWFPRLLAFTGDTYFYVNSNGNIKYNIKTQEFENYLDEDVKESLKFFNELYRAGLVDDESFTDKTDNVVDKLKTGQVFSVMNSRAYAITSSNSDLIKNGKPEMQYIGMPIQTEAQIKNKEKAITVAGVLNPGGSMAITKNAKYPERIFQVADWAASEEGQLLIQSGILGTNYLRDQNGKRSRTDEMFKVWTSSENRIKIGYWQNFYMGRIKTSPVDGQFYNLPQIKPSSDRIKEALDKYKWEQTSAWFNDQTSVFHGATIGAIVSLDPSSEISKVGVQIKELIDTAQTGLIRAGTDDEFESLWTKLVNDYNRLNPKSFTDAYNAEVNKIKAKMKN